MPVIPWLLDATSGLSADMKRATNCGAPKLQIPHVTTQLNAVIGGILTLNPFTNSGFRAAIPSFIAVNPPTFNRNWIAISQIPMMITKEQIVSVHATAFIPPIHVNTTNTASKITQHVNVLQLEKVCKMMVAPVTCAPNSAVQLTTIRRLITMEYFPL